MSTTKVRLNTPAIRVQQRPPTAKDLSGFEPLYDFFVFTLSSAVLLKVARFLSRQESHEGVQRQHKEDRDKQIGSFISSDHPFFPNTIIISLPLEFDEGYYDEATRLLDVEIDERSAYVVDGQHRLKAFASKYSQGVELPLVVTAYFGLELPTIAEVFTRINFFQVPVNKSIVYDLLGLNNDPEFTKFADAHTICEKLNSQIGSPFYNKIKMLGVGSGLLSQAAFVEAISTRYKIIPMLQQQLDIGGITDFLPSYFGEVERAFDDKWGNPESILSRTVGFNALVKILKLLLERDLSFAEKPNDLARCATALTKVDVDSEEIRAFGGFKGVNTLADRFVAALNQERLL